jgi:hypothetical protein
MLAEFAIIVGILAVMAGALMIAVGLHGWNRVSLWLYLFLAAGLESAEAAVQQSGIRTVRPRSRDVPE